MHVESIMSESKFSLAFADVCGAPSEFKLQHWLRENVPFMAPSQALTSKTGKHTQNATPRV